MSDLRRHRGKHHSSLMSLTPITFDANTFSCCGGSYFATIAVFYHHLPKTYELGRATTAHITVVIYFRDHYHWFRVCSFVELSSAFIIPPLRALQSSTSTIHTFYLQGYITRAWGMPASFVHICILFHTLWKVGSTGSSLLQRIALYGLTLALPYNTILRKRNIDEFRPYVLLLTSSIRGHLLSLKFRPHRATRTLHRQHRKTVIHGTRISSTTQQKGQNYTKLAKKLKSASHPWKMRARAQHIRTSGAYARLWGEKPARLPNGAFMELVGLPTTNGSAPKSI
jgi:hypothetical protein